MSKWFFIPGLTLLIAACATPQLPATPPATAAPGNKSQMVVVRGTQESGQKLICSYSYPLGSHIPQRICETPEKAAARRKAAQEAMQNMQQQGTIQGLTPGGPP